MSEGKAVSAQEVSEVPGVCSLFREDLSFLSVSVILLLFSCFPASSVSPAILTDLSDSFSMASLDR